MANPLPHEQEIYEKIKKENITIHPLLWELLEHHVHNELYMINLIIGSTTLDGETLSVENAQKVINHGNAIKEFLEKLEKLTRPKPGNV
jgi:5-methylcytosine-specific restriction endonuclease McrBC regulatory subunit McrC